MAIDDDDVGDMAVVDAGDFIVVVVVVDVGDIARRRRCQAVNDDDVGDVAVVDAGDFIVVDVGDIARRRRCRRQA